MKREDKDALMSEHEIENRNFDPALSSLEHEPDGDNPFEVFDKIRDAVKDVSVDKSPDEIGDRIDDLTADLTTEVPGVEAVAAVEIVSQPDHNHDTIAALNKVLDHMSASEVKSIYDKLATTLGVSYAELVFSQLHENFASGGVEQSSPLDGGEVSYDLFMGEHLKRHEIVDQEGYVRNSYEINGRRVIFRNRDELPVPSSGKYIADGSVALPTRLTRQGINSEDLGDYAAHSAEYDDREAMIVVANTPEAMLKAAIDAGCDEDGKKQRLLDEMSDGHYSKEAIAYLDSILVATQFDEHGPRMHFDYDGFAVVLASLEGDHQAVELLKRKSHLLEAYKKDLATTQLERIKEAEESSEHRLDPRKVVLVHSTSHAVQRNDAGDIILKPSGAHREDKLPRSTVHFTLNGQVSDHAYGSWGDNNTLIVANLATSIEKNGIPTVLRSSDTYFCTNLGESLVLPDAVTIKSSGDQTDLIHVDEHGDITFSYKQEYSKADHQAIQAISAEYDYVPDSSQSDAEVLREIALRIGEKNQGADTFNKIGMWGVTAGSTTGGNFNRRTDELAKLLGADVAAHAMSAEGILEHEVVPGLEGRGLQARGYAGPNKTGLQGTIEPYAFMGYKSDIRALRYLVASGYMPTRSLQSFSQAQVGDDFVL